MKVVDSYFVKFANGTSAWLAGAKPVPADAELVEVRPMIMPDDGMILRHKVTGEESNGHWLREGSADDWEEIEEPKEDVNG